MADVNGDGLLDLLVAGGGEGLDGLGSGTMGYFAGPVTGSLSIEDADRRYTEQNPGESMGNALETADINQDGYSDVLLSDS